MEPVKVSVGMRELAPLMSAVSWLVGYVEARRPLPAHIEDQVAKLAELTMRVTPLEDR